MAIEELFKHPMLGTRQTQMQRFLEYTTDGNTIQNSWFGWKAENSSDKYLPWRYPKDPNPGIFAFSNNFKLHLCDKVKVISDNYKRE
jgi:hypothetical protein